MKQPKAGRRPSSEKTEHRYSVNFTPTENARFMTMYELSGVGSKARFIKARVFDETFRVVKIDRTQLDYYQKLSALFGQFRSVGVNYNQVVATLKSNFTERKAYVMVEKLDKLTVELAEIGSQIVVLTKEFREKWSPK